MPTKSKNVQKKRIGTNFPPAVDENSTDPNTTAERHKTLHERAIILIENPHQKERQYIGTELNFTLQCITREIQKLYSVQEIQKKAKKAKNHSTRTSSRVPHNRTIRAHRSLISVFGWELMLIPEYGRDGIRLQVRAI